MSYFEDLVLNGHWKEAEDYLSGFYGVHDNEYSTKTYLGLRKQKYFEETTNYCPQLLRLRTGCTMINEVTDDAFKVVSPCLALCKTDSYAVSSSERAVCLYNAVTFKNIKSLILPPPRATCLAFYPPDYNTIVIGLDDSTGMIYNVCITEVTNRLRGHVKRISGFAFSTALRVLVPSGVDTQIIVWDYNTWEKKNSTLLHISSGWIPSETSETYVQFYQDKIHFLAVHETQLAVYEATSLERMMQWIVGDFCPRILHATLSCDNQLIYAVIRNGIVLTLGAADLTPRFKINPSVYIPRSIRFNVQPLVVSAHPQKPNQIVLGLSDGGVIIVEPLELEGKWVVQPPASNRTLAIRPIIR